MIVDEENDLERLLRLAAGSPAHRPEFYEKLLESEVLVLGGTSTGSDGSHVAEEGTTMQIQHWQDGAGNPVIPFFTSLDVLQASIDGEESFVGINARVLFEMTKGAVFVLNPKSDHGKEFVPEEIETILQGSLPGRVEERVVQQETQILLGQPAKYPSEIVDELTTLFSKIGSVKKAYLAQMHDPSSGDPPHIVIGIECSKDMSAVVEKAGVVITAIAGEGEFFDFVEIGTGGISDYLVNETSPFYQSSWGRKLRGFLGSGRA